MSDDHRITALAEALSYPTPDELLAAHRTMRMMASASYAEATGETWGEWVEATRQIALACSWLIEEDGDPYDVAWNAMMDDDDDDRNEDSD